MTVFGGMKGDDVFNEASDTSADFFKLGKGGSDTVIAGSGDDRIDMGGALNAGDRLDGGAGSDVVFLHGDYSAGLTFDDQTIQNVEELALRPGYNYNLTTADGNVAAGQFLKINAFALGAGDSLTFNGAAESDGRLLLYGGAGDDTITGGAKSDRFNLTAGGSDTAHGGGGNDVFLFGAAFTAGDIVDGGAGTDTLELNGAYTYTFGASQLTGIETLRLNSGHNYSLVTDNATVAAGATLTVDASALASSFTLGFNGSAETDGHFAFIAGAGADVLKGGALSDTFDLSRSDGVVANGGNGNDTFTVTSAAKLLDDVIDCGSGFNTLVLNGDFSASTPITASNVTNIEALTLLGAANSYDLTFASGVAGDDIVTVDASAAASLILDASGGTFVHFVVTGSAGNDHIIGADNSDTLTGGGGADTFAYTSAAQSTSNNHDTMTDFTTGTDTFDLTTAVTEVFTVSGSLDEDSNFDSELQGLNVMHIGGATEITVTGGTLAGHIILMVDGDGNAQYDAGSDYVFDITGAGTLTTGDFI